MPLAAKAFGIENAPSHEQVKRRELSIKVDGTEDIASRQYKTKQETFQ